MGKLIHFAIVLLLAATTTAYLYASNPHTYTTGQAVEHFIINVSFWTVIFGVVYMAGVSAVSFIKKYLIK